MRASMLRACVALALPLGCTAAEPEPHTLLVREPERARSVEGLAFERDDGLLALFADWDLAPGRVAMLELDGIGPAAPVVRYHEVMNGVVETSEISALTVDLRRLSDERAWVLGALAFDANTVDGERVRFESIDVRPTEAVGVPRELSGSSGSRGSGPSTGSSHTTVVVQTTYVVADGCDDGSSYGGGGCEGDTSSGGCEGDTGSGGCEGDTGSGGCEGDTVGDPTSCQVAAPRANAPLQGLWRLGWPILIAAGWNRRAQRRASGGGATSP